MKHYRDKEIQQALKYEKHADLVISGPKQIGYYFKNSNSFFLSCPMSEKHTFLNINKKQCYNNNNTINGLLFDNME